jgi:hypothetical protein
LDKLHAEAGIDHLIEGGARGADLHARTWARDRGVSRETYEADWENHGTFAGPMRNRRMLDEGKPDLVIAFPGGKGTRNMLKQARDRGVECVEIAP